MANIIQIRRDTSTNWTSSNPILAQGELGVEIDTLKFKCGDGLSTWDSLDYLINTGDYVSGPVSSTDSSVALFDGTTGKLVKQAAFGESDVARLSETQTFTGAKTFSAQLTSTVTTGTAPFVVASTTQVTNLNASQLIGGTWAAPGTIGSTTASTGAFTNLGYTGTLTGGTGVVNLGSGQFYKDASGNVGIGMTSPEAKLAVNLINSTAPTSGTTPVGIGVNFGSGEGYNAGLWFSTSFGGDQGICGIAGTRVGGGIGYNTQLTFFTNNTQSARAFTERMRITSAGAIQLPSGSPGITTAGNGHILLNPGGTGNVGIGTTSPNHLLHAEVINTGNIETVAYFRNNATDSGTLSSGVRFRLSASSNVNRGADLIAANDVASSGHSLIFAVSPAGAVPTERMRITSTGAIQLPSGSPGIVFNAGTLTGGATSKALNDYEEGTWTPVLTGSGGSAGTYAVTAPAGFYVKVGKLVKATFQLFLLTDKGSWTGQVRVSMPFVAVAKNSANTRTTSGIIFTDVHTIDAPIFANTINESYVTLRRGTQNSPGWDWASLTTSGFNYISGSIVFETT